MSLVLRSIAVRFLLVIEAVILCSCGVVGPESIKLGRTFYNDVIHQTSSDQLLLNLVRIHNHEMPLFMDVTEVDATVQIQATATGGSTQIGAKPGLTSGTLAGQVSNVAGGVQYTEAPTIRYQPLQGAALIAQLNYPITVDSIAYMFNSDWGLDAVLPFTVDRLTAGYADYFAAINAITELENNNAIIVEATRLQEQKGQGTNTTPGNANNANNNALTLFFMPKKLANGNFACLRVPYTTLNIQKVAIHLWVRLLTIYRPAENYRHFHALVDSLSSEADLQKQVLAKLPTTIEIPAASSGTQRKDRSAPLLRTRSALGVLKHMTEDEYSFAVFVSPERASSIMNSRLNQGDCSSKDFYIVDDVPGQEMLNFERHWIFTTDFALDAGDPIALRAEGALYGSRKYMLIQVSETPPLDAFVSAFENGHYYYISNGDQVSKRSLALLALITSIQAIPAQTGGLTPALSIGAR
jgi:hypothetical protein